MPTVVTPLLEARITQFYRQIHQFAYAQLANDLSIVQHSDNFPEFLSEPATSGEIINQPISTALWELIGLEDVLLEIISGERPEFQLHQSERVIRQNSINLKIYFSLYIVPLTVATPSAGLLLLLEDQSDSGIVQQRLTQERNELRLVRDRLLKVNTELEHSKRTKHAILQIIQSEVRSFAQTIYESAYEIEQESQLNHYSWKANSTRLTASSKKLLDIVANIQDLDRVQNSNLTLEISLWDLNEVVASAIKHLSLHYAIAKERFHTQFSPQVLPLLADGERLVRAIASCISTLLQFVPPTAIIVVHTAIDGVFAELRIQIEGVYFSESELGNFMEWQYRWAEPESAEDIAYNLDIYLARSIFEAHCGFTTLVSTAQQGTEFRVLLPVHLAPTEREY
jgi:K+-sensing histidine kinase KdpD